MSHQLLNYLWLSGSNFVNDEGDILIVNFIDKSVDWDKVEICFKAENKKIEGKDYQRHFHINLILSNWFKNIVIFVLLREI